MSWWLIALLVVYCIRFGVGVHYIDKGGYVERRAVGSTLVVKTVGDFVLLLLAGVIVL